MSATVFQIPQVSTIAGIAKVTRVLSTGKHTTLFLCRSIESPERFLVAKVLMVSEQEEPGITERFTQEVIAISSVQSPYVASAFGFYNADITSVQGVAKKRPGYFMEYLSGGDLATRLKYRPRLPVYTALGLLFQVASALEAVHAAEVVHADLKPENILLDGKGRAKIADFGMARLMNSPYSPLRNLLGGTLAYMSPEAIADGDFCYAGDIFSFGVLAYELLTGRFPFPCTQSLYDCIRQRRAQNAPAPISKRGFVGPQGVEDLVMKCLVHDPKERFHSGAELRETLEKYINQNSVSDGSVSI